MSSHDQQQIRVRFAPSPTGYLHIGGARAAIFNWLFAQHNKGTFLLRIEDTDLERSKPEYTQAILDALVWLEIDYSGQPVIQSERNELHKKLIVKLLHEGTAYRCYCTPEEINMRLGRAHDSDEMYSLYDRYCRDRSDENMQGRSFTVRFKVPRDKPTISFEDLIRGTIEFDLDTIDDFIIARSDSTPVYNFVVVVDDADMAISHVIRGEDHISNTPKQIMIHQALGNKVPQFAHLPLILGPSGERLSKRDAATNVLDYKEQGYLPEALYNYLVRLGWAHGDQEVFTKDEMISYFTLSAVGKKGSIFDMQKLAWLNGVYLRQLDDAAIVARIERDVDPSFKDKFPRWDTSIILKLVGLYKERVKTLKELVTALQVLHDGPREYHKAAVEEWATQETSEHLHHIVKQLSEDAVYNADHISTMIKHYAKRTSLKLVALAQPIRIALTGDSASPGIFELLELLGKDESIKRINALIEYIKSNG